MSEDLLRRRAERLAAPPSQSEATPLEFLVFALGPERYAFSLSTVRAVLHDAVTPMPGVAAGIAGAMNVRGALVSVLELRHLLGVAAPAPSEQSVLLLESSRGAVGCRVDGLPELRRVAASAVQSGGMGGPAVRGIVAGTIVWLDEERLFSALER